MRDILQLTGMVSLKFGGIERHLLEVVRLSHERGLTTALQYEVPPTSYVYRREVERFGGVFVAFRTHGRVPLRGVAALIAALREHRPRVVHAHFIGPSLRLVVPTLARVLGALDVLLTVHSEKRSSHPRLSRMSYSRYETIIAVSNAVRHDLLRMGVPSSRVVTRYIGVFPANVSQEARSSLRRDLRLSESDLVAACIGWDHRVKGLDVLLDALACAVESGVPLHLVIIGVDPRRSELPDRAKRLGVADRIRWPGIIDHAAALLPVADIYVHPARSEGLGLAILEAMALGLPVVATRVGGIPEVVADDVTGLLVPPGDPAALARALCSIITDDEKRRRMGSAAKQICEQEFNGERTPLELSEHYSDIVHGSKLDPRFPVLPRPDYRATLAKGLSPKKHGVNAHRRSSRSTRS